MKDYLLTILLLIVACSCSNNNASKEDTQNQEVMNEEQYQEYLEDNGLIAIPYSFEPTIKLTKKIKDTSLEQLIIDNAGQYSKEDQKKIKEKIKELCIKWGIEPDSSNSLLEIEAVSEIESESLYDIPESRFHHVKATSNLAKVFYLEDKGKFQKYNQQYISNIENKKNKKEEEDFDEKRRKQWAEYEK